MRGQVVSILRYAFVQFVLVVLIASYAMSEAHAQDAQGWDAAEAAQSSFWMKSFSIPRQSQSAVSVNQTFDKDDDLPFTRPEPIYGLTLSGTIKLNSKAGLVRLVLVDDKSNEYLIYEAYPLLVNKDSFTVTNVCEETCVLEPTKPVSIRLQIVDASIRISELAVMPAQARLPRSVSEIQKDIRAAQVAQKVKEINANIKKTGLKWTAGETSVSKLPYSEKKKLFGAGDKKELPNLQGFEYYTGGIFEIKQPAASSKPPDNPPGSGSSLIDSFDWRNRHGANDPDSPYYDGDPNGSGWITSVKNQSGCGSCWAFAATGATEALANLYFNQHLDLDLAEQDALSCSGAGSCQGGWPGLTLDYYTNTGVVDEACFPYTATDGDCADRCATPNESIRISGKVTFGSPKTEETLKRMIIDYGPVSGGIYSWSHAMVLLGYDKDPDDGRTVWTFKNSWGSDWGDHGYGYLIIDINDIGWTHALLNPVTSSVSHEIKCIDRDNDGYYNWGIAESKPASCPANALAEKDCDDATAELGPFNSDGSCRQALDVAIVSVSTGKPYALGDAEVGDKVYIDRDYTINSLSSALTGGVLVRTANDDKRVEVANHLVLRVHSSALVYVAYDKRATKVPTWLGEWKRTDEVFRSTDSSASPMVVYRKQVAAGEELTLGGNHHGGDTGARSNYFVVVQSLPVEIISVSTGKPYTLAEAEIGALAYIDRQYKVTAMTSGLNGGVLVRTANDDKRVKAANHLMLRLHKDASIHVCYDKRGAGSPPTWLTDGTWTRADNESISTTDSPASPMVVLKREVNAGEEITLGGNHQGGGTAAGSNYLVIVNTR